MSKKTIKTYRAFVLWHETVDVQAASKREAVELIKAGHGERLYMEPSDKIEIKK